MKPKNLFTVMVLLLCCMGTAWASGRTVTGEVLDESSEPLAGATVKAQPSGAVTATDSDGLS